MGQAFADLLGGVPQAVEFLADGFGQRQLRVGVTLLYDQLVAHCGGGQPGVKSLIAKLGIGLALPIHDLLDIGEQVRQPGFGRLAAA